MQTTIDNKRGLMPNDPDIKHYKLYAMGNAWTPFRFWDFALIDTRTKNANEIEQRYIKNGWIKHDLTDVINRFDGISLEYLITA